MATLIATASDPRIPHQTPTGNIAPSKNQQIETGPGWLYEIVIVRTTGAGTSYLQFHDVGGGLTISDSTLIGVGYELNNSNEFFVRSFPEKLPLKFVNGLAVIISDSIISYVPNATHELCAFAIWETPAS